MQELLKEYLGELKGKQKRRRRINMIVAAFAIIIVGGVIWGLIQSGIAMTGEPRCGMEEHTHSDSCYSSELVCGQEESEGHQHTDACYETQSTLICGMEESEATEESEGHVHTDACYATEQVLVCGQEEGTGHKHTDACYKEQLICGEEEHIHSDLCYIDTNADVEEASNWDEQYKDVEWKDAWGEDLVTVAKAQVGYKESTKNYTVAEDGSHKGYTRYGQFAGDVYADWDAMFVNFCMHYAGLEDSNLFPNEKAAVEWYNKFVQVSETNLSYITAPEGYEPKAGDLIFFNKEEENEFRMGVVSSYNKEKNEIKVIEGNSENEVKENEYDTDDEYIYAYLKITELETAYKDNGDEETTAAEEGAPDETEAPVEDTTEQEDPEAEGTTEQEEPAAEDTTEQKVTPAYEEKYEDDTIVINVSAAEGVVPEGAKLSVTPIEQKKVTMEMSKKEAAEVEKVNEQYELTSQKLQEESEKKKETLEGFLAYDICFIVDGEEVEPSGDVKVTMDFKEATKPEGVSENATVAVNHLKEDESAEDGIVVEDLTEKEDTTIATAETGASVEKVEIVAESFSTFTILWYIGGTPLPVNIEIEAVDEKGNIINSASDMTLTLNNDEEKDLLDVFDGKIESEETGEFYECKEIRVIQNGSSYNAEKVKAQGGSFSFYDSQGKWHSYTPANDEHAGMKIQLICRKVAAVEIKDDVKESGCLRAVGGDNVIAQYPNKIVNYVWLKSVNGGAFEEVQSVRYGEMTTISNNGTLLNVALDEGGLTSTRKTVRYQVKLQMTDEEGTIKTLAESEIYSVPYYSEVQNGSFENPLVGELKYEQPFMDKVPGWSTTDTIGGEGGKGAGCIEIVRPNVSGEVNNFYGESQPIYADDGKQYAEINAEGNGALYQDVLTLQGRPLNYYFSHRGRENSGNAGDDVMYVVIVPTKLAVAGLNDDNNPIDTNKEVEALMNTSEDFKRENGVYIKQYTAKKHVWQRHEGVYEATTSMTRFFFVSSQNGVQTQGNYIDRVSFSQDLPEPVTNMFNLKVEKTVKGLELTGDSTAEKIEDLKKKLDNLSFEIEVKNKQTGAIVGKVENSELLTGEKVTIKATDMIWYLDNNDSFTGYYNYIDNPIEETYTVSVTETNKFVTGYTVEDTSKTTIIPVTGDTTKIDGSTTDVESQQSIEITHINMYTKSNVDPTATKKIEFTKKWEDFHNGYTTRPSSLKVKLIGKIPDEKNPDSLKTLSDTEIEVLFKEFLEENPNKTLNDIICKTLPLDGNKDNDEWKYTWEYIPVYYDKEGKIEITWVVEEELIDNNYRQVDPQELQSKATLIEAITDTPEAEKDEEYTITNALNDEILGNWKMVKHSTSDITKTLQGAEFKMRTTGLFSTVVANGMSNTNGEIIWTPVDTAESWDVFKKTLNGSYLITEEKAPGGYSRNETGWTVEFVNGIVYVEKPTDIQESGDIETGIVFYIGNTALYALPDAGGSGIYWYMFSGILLMAGAALITYKKRCREVLRS